MDERPQRVVDYTIVVGLGDNPSPFKVETYGEHMSLSLTTPSNILFVTDIAIIAKKYETCPKGFKCIEETPNGSSAGLTTGGLFNSSQLFLCYKIGGDKAPITEISIHNAEGGKHCPHGHEIIALTAGGRSAELGGGRYPIHLTYKRGLTHGYDTSMALSELTIISTKEEPPHGMKMLPTSLGKSLISSGIRICYKSSLFSHPTLAYTAEILSRYPTLDYNEFPLPESVPLFCLPFGVSIEAWERHAPFPLPKFSTFALTSAVGQCMYGACIIFYETVPSTLPELSNMRRLLEQPNEADNLYMNKCVCLLSHWPFFSAFKSFLSALYRISLSKNSPLPLERYVANLMFNVPFPSIERPRTLLLIGPETISFSLPVQTPLPMSVSTHWTLLTCLDVDNCIQLMHLALLEQKIVLHSSQSALLTSVGEALRSILFPLQWKCSYIPMCPLAFCSYLQAPVPYIIGMDSRYFNSYSAPNDVCVVDLDINHITIDEETMRLIDENPLPMKPVKLLKKNLSVLANEVSSYRFDGFAVEVAPMEGVHKLEQERTDVSVRECFLKFMAVILVNYRSYLRPLLTQPSPVCQDISDLFDIQGYTSSKPSAERSFYKCFCNTQLFTSFIEQSSFAISESSSLTFFDECTEKMSGDVNAKLLNVEVIVSKRVDLPTVVTPPPDDSALPQGVKYSYQSFPPLDSSLFLSPYVAVNSPYIVSTPQLSKTVSQSAIINVAVRTQSEKVKSKNLIRRACGSDVLWANVLLSHACSLWYMLLSNHLRSQWNKFEVLSQGMEILDALRARDALPSDEVCYRVLMEQCVQIGRPALAVKVYTEMRKAGVHPSAVTYGFYNKAIMEGIWPSTKRRWNVLKIVLFACFYLRKLQRDSTNKKDKGTFITTEETQVSFQLLRRPSETDISALDMAVSDDDIGQRRGSMGRISRESVYRTASVKREQQGDYAVRGDSFYITDKAPLLRSPVKRVGWNLGRHFSTRRSVKDSYHRTSARGSDGASVEVCLCSCSQCPNCQSLIYDEEIMVSWSEGSAAEYNISCPYCYKSLVPSLTIIIRKILPVDLSGCHNSQRRDSLQSQSGIVSSPQQITTELPANHSSSLPEEDEEISLKVAQTEPVHRKSLSIGGDNTCPSAADVIDNGDDTGRSDNGVMVRSRTLTLADKPVTSQVPLTKTPSPTINVEDTDSSNISHYISLLRGRGHKRISSAPVTLSPVTSKSPHQTKSNSPAPQSENGDRELPPVKMRPRRSSVLIEDKDPFTVPYLSPIVLRKELESLLTQGKDSILNSDNMTTDKPILYWNLVWYFSRLKLPTYLPLFTLRRIIKELPDYRQTGIKMNVKTLWDKKLPGISDPLYLIWMGEVQIPMDTRRRMRRDSNSQLQPMVARMQCGDLQYIMRSLLNDKRQDGSHEYRSIYRQMLFLKCVLQPDLDIEMFDKEYQLNLQKLPKELAVLLQSWDYPPTAKASNCRKEFGILQII